MQEMKADILKLWEEKQLRITDEIQTAPEVLYANGSVIGTLGNFSASTGKAKSKRPSMSPPLSGLRSSMVKYWATPQSSPMTSAQSFISTPNKARIIVRRLWSERCDWQSYRRTPTRSI